MKCLIKLIAVLLISLCFKPKTTTAQCHIVDWTALKALYESTDGDDWINNTNWQEITGNAPTANCNLENLYGVGLNEQGRVNNLYLDSNQLIGSIPLEFGNLSNLESLYLYTNQLMGSIPPEVGNLSNLIRLDLDYNQLTGSIPLELGNLSNLQILYLYNNQLSGSIPPELGDLSNLTLLVINDNDLSGCYSDNLSILCTQLNDSRFDGDIDISFGNNFDASWEDFCATSTGACIANSSDVWPGDVNHDGNVNNQDDALLFLYFDYNNNNIAREEQGITWQAYACPDWGFQVTGAYNNDIKHFDCNGDGLINTADKNAIIINWGSMHTEANNNISGIYPLGDFPSNNKIYLQPTGDVSNGLLIMDIILEHTEGTNLELYGGFFTIQYPTPTVTEANVVFASSWLGFPNSNLNMDYKDFPAQQKVEIGFSRTNGTNATGSGIIGQVAFTINEHLRSDASEQVLDFEAINIGAHNNVGAPIAISNQYQPVNIGMVNCESSITINQTTPFQNLYQSNGAIQTSDGLIVGQNQQVEYNANRVTLNEGFSVKAGADFKVRSNGCN